MPPAPLVLKKDGDKIVGTSRAGRRGICPSRPTVKEQGGHHLIHRPDAERSAEQSR